MHMHANAKTEDVVCSDIALLKYNTKTKQFSLTYLFCFVKAGHEYICSHDLTFIKQTKKIK